MALTVGEGNNPNLPKNTNPGLLPAPTTTNKEVIASWVSSGKNIENDAWRGRLTYNANQLVYNVGCVTDAYHSTKDTWKKALGIQGSDRPSKIAAMSDLWTKAGTNKGMIALFVPKDKSGTIDTAIPSATSKLKLADAQRYAFQFHYNPTAIHMSYAGAPNTDVGLEVSGNEKFNLLGAQVSQSTISFPIIFNRIADHKYYGSDGKILPSVDANKIYYPNAPSISDQQLIYNKGTMYDIEFLLSTVIGYRLNTAYRGTTADVGWLSGRPIELNLGKSLRYWGFINSFEFDHKMFNERMVPIYTEATLSFNRIPDYKGLV